MSNNLQSSGEWLSWRCRRFIVQPPVGPDPLQVGKWADYDYLQGRRTFLGSSQFQCSLTLKVKYFFFSPHFSMQLSLFRFVPIVPYSVTGHF